MAAARAAARKAPPMSQEAIERTARVIETAPKKNPHG
jgi:hypothetical protein